MIGAQLGSYRILEELGKGGMGTVYKAVDTSLDRMVAVKVLSSEYSTNPELVERFRLEARAQANLNHTNIAMLHAFIAEGGQAWMVMEFIEGETFAQMLQRRGLLPAQVAVPLFKQALLGIGYAHRAGIVHRDLKPANLMVNKEGIVKVMDFGIAKVIGSRGMTRTGTTLGTAYYMSPEQVMNRAIDIRSDIYSLGVTLYEMLTANLPFQGDSDFQILSNHVYMPPPPPSQFYPYIPKPIEDAVMLAMAKDPNGRFQTVEEFGAALERTEASPPLPAPGPVVGVVTSPQPPVMAPPPPPLATPPRGFTPIPGATPAMGPPQPTVPHAGTPPPFGPPPGTGPGQPVVTPPPPPPLDRSQQPVGPKPPGGSFLSTTNGKLIAGGGAALLVAAIVVLSLPKHHVDPTPIVPALHEGTLQPEKKGGPEVPVWPPPGQSAKSGPELKVLQFGAAAKRVSAGQKARLSWSVEGAADVTISPAVGTVNAQGSTEVAVDRTTEFTLTAKKITGEQVTSTVVVEVGPAAPAGVADLKVTFEVQPSSITSGQSATLRWSVPGAQSVKIAPGLGDVPAPAGSMRVTPQNTMSYTLVARGKNGAVGEGDVTVEVRQIQKATPPPNKDPNGTVTGGIITPPPPAAPVTPVVNLMATPNSIQAGGTAMLVWSIKNAYSASITPAPGVLKQTVGQYSVSPASTTTYTLTARSQDGTTATATATVQVQAAAAPPTPVAPPPVAPTASSGLVAVVHDHGVLNQYAWPSCWGTLQVANGILRYVVIGTNDGRRDDFQVPVGEVQEIKVNKLRIRNQPAFHIQIGRQHFNFVTTQMAAAQAAIELERAAKPR